MSLLVSVKSLKYFVFLVCNIYRVLELLDTESFRVDWFNGTTRHIIAFIIFLIVQSEVENG